jgi:hypothetical protein
MEEAMNTTNVAGQKFSSLFRRIRLHRGLAFGLIIITALFAFEAFNYSTTDFALSDLLGNLTFLGIRWATILAIAFCGIDFAGIARLFTPEAGMTEQNEVWYLFGAWLLAATMNAMLTWWGVSLAILNHQTLGNAVIERTTLLRVVPIFVAVLVWLIRVLIIGTFSVAGDRLFTQSDKRQFAQPRQAQASLNSTVGVRSLTSRPPAPRPVAAAPANPSYRTLSKPSIPSDTPVVRPEPTYHSLSMSASPSTSTNPTGSQGSGPFSKNAGSQVRR